jgi:Domain of unknown function (DUF4136)
MNGNGQVSMLDGRAQLPRTLLAMGVAFWLASCAMTPEVASDYDRSANFATYHTFTLMQRQHRGISNPLVAIRTEEDITQELLRRGYALAADPTSADFTVDFTIGSQERTDISSYPAAYAGPWLLGGPYWGSNINVRQYREGTLAIDVFDGHTHRPVWHGWAQKELTSKDLEQPAEPISEAVSSILARFPPA